MTIVYLGGPMSGRIEYNYPAFHACAAKLRAQGLTVISPAEIEAGVIREWAWHMRKDIAELLKCDRIHLLPGWETSTGAKLEKHIAETLHMEVTYEEACNVIVGCSIK